MPNRPPTGALNEASNESQRRAPPDASPDPVGGAGIEPLFEDDEAALRDDEVAVESTWHQIQLRA